MKLPYSINTVMKWFEIWTKNLKDKDAHCSIFSSYFYKQLHPCKKLYDFIFIIDRLSCVAVILCSLPSSDNHIDNMLYSTLILQLRSWLWYIGILRIQLRGWLLPFIIPLKFYNHLFHVISSMNSYFRKW